MSKVSGESPFRGFPHAMDGGCRQNGQNASLGFMEVAHHAFSGTDDLLD
jgi:hypothetical protein